MSDITIEHLTAAILAAVPGAIAAISSLRNGQEQKRVREELREVNGHLKKNLEDGDTASDPDWYRAPALWPCFPTRYDANGNLRPK